MTQTDLRDEEMRRVSNSPIRPGPTSQVPSPNLKRVLDALEEGELKSLLALAEKIERGDAQDTDAERDMLYDNFGKLLDYVQDLAQMCLRREYALAECDVKIGFEP